MWHECHSRIFKSTVSNSSAGHLFASTPPELHTGHMFYQSCLYKKPCYTIESNVSKPCRLGELKTQVDLSLPLCKQSSYRWRQHHNLNSSSKQLQSVASWVHHLRHTSVEWIPFRSMSSMLKKCWCWGACQEHQLSKLNAYYPASGMALWQCLCKLWTPHPSSWALICTYNMLDAFYRCQGMSVYRLNASEERNIIQAYPRLYSRYKESVGLTMWSKTPSQLK